MEEVGQHQERSGTTRTQRPPSDLLRGTHPARGDREEGTAAEGEEVDETGERRTQNSTSNLLTY